MSHNSTANDGLNERQQRMGGHISAPSVHRGALVMQMKARQMEADGPVSVEFIHKVKPGGG